MLYYFKKGTNIIEMQKRKKFIFAAYGEDAVTDRTCQKWFVMFCSADFSLEGAPWLGRPVEVVVVIVQSLSYVWLFVTPGTVAHQAPLSWHFSGKNNGVGCHFLLQRIFPDAGIKPMSPALADRFFTIEPLGKPLDEVDNNRIKTLSEGNQCYTSWEINQISKSLTENHLYKLMALMFRLHIRFKKAHFWLNFYKWNEPPPTTPKAGLHLSKVISENIQSSIRIMQDCMFIWWPGKNCYSLAGTFWFIHHIHQRLHLRISTYFCLYHILLTETILVPWKTVKGTWSSSLLNKIKSFGKMELQSCLKNGRR